MPSWTEFQRLPTPAAPTGNDAETFAAAANTGQSWLARDYSGSPCLIISVRSPAGRSESRLELLSIQISVPCEIQSPHGASRATLTVLRCTSLVAEHQRLFVSLIDVVIAAIGEPATAAKVHEVIQQLSAMFSSLSRPPRTTVQGLWGELLLIASARDPARLMRAWHATTGDDFDFSEGESRLEAKTTSSHRREHVFTLDQVRPPLGTEARVASMIVRPAGGGTSIAALVADIERVLAGDPTMCMKLHTLVIETLGEQWADSADCRFDLELGASSLAYYCPESIPQLVGALPPGVSRVTFASDLSLATPVSAAPAGSLFEAAMPAHSAPRRAARNS